VRISFAHCSLNTENRSDWIVIKKSEFEGNKPKRMDMLFMQIVVNAVLTYLSLYSCGPKVEPSSLIRWKLVVAVDFLTNPETPWILVLIEILK